MAFFHLFKAPHGQYILLHIIDRYMHLGRPWDVFNYSNLAIPFVY